LFIFFLKEKDGIGDGSVTGVQTCALPIFIKGDMAPPPRRKAYDCDITYGTNSEFGFDYLRDNMKPARWGDPHYPPHVHQCQKMRSEERRVGKECRCGWGAYHEKKINT